MSRQITIATIIPTSNRKDYLHKILTQLQQQKIKAVNQKIVVIVDGSTDGTNEMLETEFPNVSVLKGTGNWGFTRCLNEGIQYAAKFSPDYILTMSDYVEIRKDFIEKLYKASEKVEKNSIIGVMSVSNTKPYRITFSGVKKIIKWSQKLIHYLPPSYETNIDKLTGAYPTKTIMTRMLIPFMVLEELDYFDKRFFHYGSDEDFCYRAIKKGYKAYISWDAKVFENIDLASESTAYKKLSLSEFAKSFFNKYSTNHLGKEIRFYARHGHIILLPIFTLKFILGTCKAYFLKNRK